MACLGDYWLEFQELTELATPSVITNVLESLLVVADVAMLGRLGRGHIAALAVGNGLFNLVWYFIEGFFTAQDTLCSIAFNQGDLKALRYWTYASLGSILFLCSIATAMFIFSDFIFEDIFFVSPHLRSKAVLHVYLLTPSIWFYGLFRVMQKFLSAQNIMKPTIHALIVGNVCNAILNYLFIFLLGFGFMGTSISTTISRGVMMFYLFYRTRKVSTFVHMRPELQELVKGTSAQSLLHAADYVDETLYGASAQKTYVRGRGLLAKGIEHVGVTLHIRPLVRWARNWDQVEKEDDAALEMSSLLKDDKRSNNDRKRIKPSSAIKKSGRIVPYDEGGNSHHSNDENSMKSSSIEDMNNADEETVLYVDSDENTSYLDDVKLDDDLYTKKHGLTPRPASVVKNNKSNYDKSPKNSSHGDHSKEQNSSKHGNESSKHRDEDSDDGSADDEKESTDSESDSEDEESRDARRGPRMLMLVRILRFLAIGVPGGLMVGLESWVFCILVIFVSRIGIIPTAATFIGMVFIETVFLAIPFAISVATTLRVSQLLLNNKYEKASVCSIVSLTVGTCAVGLTGFLTYNLPKLLGHLFTTDEDVIYRIIQIAPYLAGYQVIYGIMGLSQGILRAQGKQLEVVFFTFSSLYLIGLPLSWWWGFYVRPTHGLFGYWAGMLVGMGLLALLLFLMVAVTNWHYESRAMIVRADREKEGFSRPSASNMWMNKGMATAGGGAGLSNMYDEDDVFSPIATEESVLPMVGAPSIGSRAVGGFALNNATLEEIMNETEEIDILKKVHSADPTSKREHDDV